MSRKEPQVLEAVTAMARIATLAFYPEGTKVAFRNHNIVLCPPSSVYGYNLIPTRVLQGIDRYWNSDSRDDLHIFNHVIKNFIDLYVESYRRKDRATYDNLINLAKYTCVGLMKLQKTYASEHCNAVIVIQFYINILRDLVREKLDLKSFYIPEGDDAKPIISEGGEQSLTMSTIFDMDKIRTFWSQKELNRLCDQFNGCFKKEGQVEEAIFSNNAGDPFGLILGDITEEMSRSETDSVHSSDSIMDSPVHDSGASAGTSGGVSCKDGKTELISIDSDEQQFNLPEPSNGSLPIVKGLIVSIIAILDAMDDRFSTILTQSMRGIK